MKDIFPDRVETVEEKPLSKKDRIIIAIYDYFQRHKRLEKLIPYFLAAIFFSVYLYFKYWH
ncbi:hypothetical protein [Escherichia coli]|uniref:hypothetical protein n=1 Tax=Escherichia coli TaxID=562 RepID=UPI001FF14A54|nr:hypothetical protein [Escherichia coli]